MQAHETPTLLPTIAPATGPPRWPRLAARIVGTIQLFGIAFFLVAMTLNALFDGGDVTGESASSTRDYVFFTVIAVSMGIIGLGLAVAWWREGLGAALVFAGIGLMVAGSFGAFFFFSPPFLLAGGL
jgi:hypothetical protein